MPENTMAADSFSSMIASMTFSIALEGSIQKRRGGKSKKSVSFSNEQHTVHHIEHAADFTEEESHQTWFSRQDFSDIKASYRDILKRMSRREHIAEEECSTRGLEGRSRHGSKNRLSIIMTSILAVLNEQDVQRKQGRFDAETIAILYRHQSYHSLQAAVMMARRDEASIAEYTGRRPQQQRMIHTAADFGSQPRTDPQSRRALNLGLRRPTVANPALQKASSRPSATTMQRRAAAA